MANNLICKKLKTDGDEIRFFKEFLAEKKNAKLIRMLRRVISQARLAEYGFYLTFLRINGSNATIDESFSEARVDVDVIKNEDDEICYVPLAVCFLSGFEVLINFLDENQPFITDDLQKRRSLMNLLKFLTKDSTFDVESSEKETEWNWAVRFAQHVLLPLAPQKRYCIDNHYSGNESCFDENQMDGEIGDTSYGCAKGWHGAVDLIIKDKGVPLSVLRTESESFDEEWSVDEMKTSEKNSSDRQQVIAQTIVFSFLQHKLKANSFVPGLGVSSQKLIFYMYDCVEDVLLCGQSLELFNSSGKIRIPIAVILWLLLNYDLFGNAIPTSIKIHKANFHEQIGQTKLDMYMNEVRQPCHVEQSERKNETETIVDDCYIDFCTLLSDSNKGTSLL